MDVSAAYPNTSHQRILHNVRKRKIDIKVVDWVASFLTDRHTIVKTNELTTSKLSINLGLPQGSLRSSILCLFYNGDLLDDCAKKGVDAQGYIDDITLIATGKPVKSNSQKLAMVHNQVCKNWRVKHRSEFGFAKYQLIHITRKRNVDYTSRVKLRGGHLIKGAITAVNLGITLQSKLSWKDHVSKIKEKVIKSIWALSSIIGSTWGGNYHSHRKIFKAVIIPQLAYRASIWYTPTGEKRNQKTLVMQLVQAQAMGARLITEVFKATSAQALNIEAYLTPIDLELDKKIIQTAARLFSGPLYHTLTQGRSTHVKQTLTRLETLEKYYVKFFGSKIDELESRPAYFVPPWWCFPSINILSSKETATQLHDQCLTSKTLLQIVAYTDGSGINNQIGSSFVIPKKSKIIKKFLGARTRCTVYMGELQGIQDSPSYALGQNQSLGIQIFTDNQAALQALESPNKCSAPQIMQTITQHIDDLRVRRMAIHLQWIPAHNNIRGNEEADIAAKEAKGWRRAKRKKGKWSKWDSGHTAKKHEVSRARTIIKLE